MWLWKGNDMADNMYNIASEVDLIKDERFISLSCIQSDFCVFHLSYTWLHKSVRTV